MKMRIFVSALLAGSMLATPAMSQQRKTLFQVLFPKAHKERLARQRSAAERVKPQRVSLPKVKTSKNYAYKVSRRSLIKLAPVPVVIAVANVGTENDSDSAQQINAPKMTTLTRDIIAAGELKLRTEDFLASVISDHYKTEQSYLWLNDDGEWNAKARSTFKVLKFAGEYGLNAEDYAVEGGEIALSNIDNSSSVDAITVSSTVSPTTEGSIDKSTEATDRVRREISMSTAVLRYAMDASFGTVNPNRLSGYHDFPEHYGKAADLMDKVVLKGLPANTLRTLHPSNEKFAALKRELISLQGAADDVIELKINVLVKPGQSNSEIPNIVAAIKQRGSKVFLEQHSGTLTAYAGEEKYTKELVALVKGYQKEAGIGADGIIGKNTMSKLSGISSSSKTDKVRLAMERLRWHPHQFGARHVLINQPEYRARYIENGAEKLAMRVVVGKKSNQTNFFYDAIEHVEYNPYWNVPRSIIVNEFLPKSLGNPGYLDQRGYEVRTWGGKSLSSSSINWYDMGSNPKIAVRQPPGPKNALGELKIMFPNKHAIYMHDTPSKSLFKKQNRAFSHGCVRLHDPRAMAAAVMGTSKSAIASRVAQGKNLTEKLPSKVPVYVSYFTAWPQENGTVKYFSDMYGRDTHLLKAMDATRKARSISVSS